MKNTDQLREWIDGEVRLAMEDLGIPEADARRGLADMIEDGDGANFGLAADEIHTVLVLLAARD